MKYIRTENGLEKMTDEQYDTYKESQQPAETYLELRAEAYGTPAQQIEFITENGLQAWQDNVAEIKVKFPKGSE